MKEDTQNCLWQDSTHSKINKNTLNKRLHIFTGKGGTGKTSLALAFAGYLKSKRKKVVFNNIGQSIDKKILKTLNIPSLELDTRQCMQSFMAGKLNSEIISKWIMETGFFKSLFNIVPGLGYITFLGHIIKLLEEDPKLHIIIDAEASGHAMTMFESPFNFKEIFLSGVLVKDLELITSCLSDRQKTSIYAVCTPTPMSVVENMELIDKLGSMGMENVYPLINNSFYKLSSKNIPGFLEKKIQMEQKSISQLKAENTVLFSHHSELDQVKIIKDLKKEIGGMVL